MENGKENAIASTENRELPSPEQDLTRAKNPNPRANENIEGDALEEGAAEGVGSEITDGEAS